MLSLFPDAYTHTHFLCYCVGGKAKTLEATTQLNRAICAAAIVLVMSYQMKLKLNTTKFMQPLDKIQLQAG